MKTPETGDYATFKESVLALPFTIADEQVCNENGVVLADGTVELAWIPVHPGTLRGTIDTDRWVEEGSTVVHMLGVTLAVYDDMDGNLLIDGHLAGSINYYTGCIRLKPSIFSHAEYVFGYFFDSGKVAALPLNYTLNITSSVLNAHATNDSQRGHYVLRQSDTGVD